MVTINLRIAAFIVIAAVGLAPIMVAPAFAADPLGTWLTGDKKGKVRIVNCGGAICGSLVWIDEPLDPETKKPKIDKRNADASKQSRPLLGIPIVLNMKPSSTPQSWEGDVYNAEDGKTYSGSFTLTGANTAQLKGCVLGGLICKAQTWTRSNERQDVLCINPRRSRSARATRNARSVPLRPAGKRPVDDAAAGVRERGNLGHLLRA